MPCPELCVRGGDRVGEGFSNSVRIMFRIWVAEVGVPFKEHSTTVRVSYSPRVHALAHPLLQDADRVLGIHATGGIEYQRSRNIPS